MAMANSATNAGVNTATAGANALGSALTTQPTATANNNGGATAAQ